MLTLRLGFFLYMLIRRDERKDGETDMPKLIVAFRNFAKTPKMDTNVRS
jgi:hypothetical protein